MSESFSVETYYRPPGDVFIKFETDFGEIDLIQLAKCQLLKLILAHNESHVVVNICILVITLSTQKVVCNGLCTEDIGKSFLIVQISGTYIRALISVPLQRRPILILMYSINRWHCDGSLDNV